MAEEVPPTPVPTPEVPAAAAPEPAAADPISPTIAAEKAPEPAAEVAAPAPVAAAAATPFSTARIAAAVEESPGQPVPAADVSQTMDAAAIEELLKEASFDDGAATAAAAGPELADAAADFRLPDFQQVMQDAQVSSIDLLRDVDLNVKIELGRSRMLVEDVLKLSEGSVVELDKLAGDPVDVFVNERLVARGEVLVLNDNFCVRINEIVAGVREEGM